MHKKELTERQKKDLEGITEKYDSIIAVEQNKIDAYTESIEEISNKRKIHKDKIKKIQTQKNREITSIKDSELFERYKKNEVKENDEYSIIINSGESIRMGSYVIQAHLVTTQMDMYIEGETPTQYRLYMIFTKGVYISNSSSWFYSNNIEIHSIRFNMKKINLMKFLEEHSVKFRRDINISNILD